MAKIFLNSIVAVLVFTLAGCHDPDSGKSQLLPCRLKVEQNLQTDAGEINYVEQMAMNRQAYRQTLELLIKYYRDSGNNMKLGWAKNELESFNKLPQYNYIIEAAVAGPELIASEKIPLADYMYEEARQIEKKTDFLILFKDESRLRLALNKYNLLIRKHPSSDKIDDAAYRAAGILSYFKDYSLALLYYQRTYQWNRNTPYNARYKAAYILDYRLQKRLEALKLYRQSLEKEKLSPAEKEIIERRIADLTKSEGKLAE